MCGKALGQAMAIGAVIQLPRDLFEPWEHLGPERCSRCGEGQGLGTGSKPVRLGL